jgi:hypothetical protein
MTLRPVRHAAAFVAPLILTIAAAGCDSLLDTSQDYAEDAQLLVTGTSPVPLRVILSNNFTNIQNPEDGSINTQLIVADTFELTLPINHTYPMGNGARIFVRVWQPDSTQTADVLMRVLLDGEREVYEQRATLRDAYLEYTFTYF